jgi:betaine-aldehyde dehydrogenase
MAPLTSRHSYYNGRVQEATGSMFHSIDPSTARPITEIYSASHANVDAAIESAEGAFEQWSKRTSAIARARILLKAVMLLRERNDEIARTETQDTG